MQNLVKSLKSMVQKRSHFYRTYSELRAMPRNTAIDLGMFPEDAYAAAYQAVYK